MTGSVIVRVEEVPLVAVLAELRDPEIAAAVAKDADAACGVHVADRLRLVVPGCRDLRALAAPTTTYAVFFTTYVSGLGAFDKQNELNRVTKSLNALLKALDEFVWQGVSGGSSMFRHITRPDQPTFGETDADFFGGAGFLRACAGAPGAPIVLVNGSLSIVWGGPGVFVFFTRNRTAAAQAPRRIVDFLSSEGITVRKRITVKYSW